MVGTFRVFLLLYAYVWCLCVTSSDALSIRELPILPVCCNYQKQFSEEFSNCTTKPPNDLLTFDEQLNVPPHLISDGYKNRSSLQNYKFRLKKDTPVCPDGSFTMSFELNEPNIHDSTFFITPNSHLQLTLDYYSPKEYCIDAMDGNRVTLAICKPTCGEGRPCIPKCCDLGQAWNFADSDVPHCGDLPIGTEWQPPFHSDRFNKVSRERQAALIPHYVLHHPANGFCDYGHPIIFSLSALQNHGFHAIVILEDGSVVARARRRQWVSLPRGDYCLDTIRNPFQSTQTIEADPETIIFYCHKEVETSEGLISKVYGTSMIIASFFLIFTLIVFGLLWDKYKGNVQRWTICCYVAALLLMYTFFILSYFSPEFDSEVSTNAGMCRFIGIGMHFTFLMNFCFLSCINFEIWWTVRSFAKLSTYFQGFKRLYTYIGFAVGLPLTIVSIGLILDSIYESDLNSDVIIPEYGRYSCNIGSFDAFWVYMYGPLGILLVGNIAFFVTTVVTMWSILRAAKSSSGVTVQYNKESDLLSRFGKLYIIQGVPWIFEFISFAFHGDESKWYWILFDLINIFQSVAIFIIFVCNLETAYDLRERYQILRKLLTPLIGDPNRRIKFQREDEDSGKISTVEIGPAQVKDSLEMN